MKLLRQMVGEEIMGLIPLMDPKIIKVLRLRSLDVGGLWVESEEFTQMMLTGFKVPASSRTPLMYLPFHEIKFLLQSTEQIALSEKAFGV
jgi:hypothetical protein